MNQPVIDGIIVRLVVSTLPVQYSRMDFIHFLTHYGLLIEFELVAKLIYNKWIPGVFY